MVPATEFGPTYHKKTRIVFPQFSNMWQLSNLQIDNSVIQIVQSDVYATQSILRPLSRTRPGDCVRASWSYSFIVQRIDRYSYSYFCVCFVLLLYHAGSAPLDFYFGLVAKINIIVRAKSKQASCAEMVLGSLFSVPV